ncbi:glutamyl-tRNA reductase [Granulicella pectinivorans]|uniref:Glutamyl-tRNA reductase n=1 Tax=Granulicella pectinivorans TaxID=474950 RepID=A0A1I6M9V8_9BACT|nr:glutamyl-tRNA reductase [Granulicella pectinivorans]SFS12510.1 glutamyl-tRNA reductase [Granulicella pectinivorans]
MSQNLVLLGINHTTAPIEVRERLAIPAGRLADATRTLLHQPGIREGLILSTCNRVELLTLQQDTPDLLRFLDEYFAVPAATIRPHLYEFREREAVRHLFRVASSLDSMVVGEPQILGQVKESYTVAREVGAVASNLEGLLQRAFTVAKRVRTETQVGSSSVSIASVAVDLARKIFGSLSGKTILLVGAGKMSELAARHLIQQGAASILVSNRTYARAEKIAATITASIGEKPVTAEILPFEDLYAHAHRADIVITSTGAPDKIFTRAHGRQFLDRRRNRPMFFIDIAVPRDVDPDMNKVEGCFVYDIDDLQQTAAANLADRSREAAAAETIVSGEVDRYQQRIQSLDAVPAIKALQQSAEIIRLGELGRIESKLGDLTPAQREVVEAMTRSLTAKLLHPQLTALRDPSKRNLG